jgi:hypothetical protein
MAPLLLIVLESRHEAFLATSSVDLSSTRDGVLVGSGQASLVLLPSSRATSAFLSFSFSLFDFLSAATPHVLRVREWGGMAVRRGMDDPLGAWTGPTPSSLNNPCEKSVGPGIPRGGLVLLLPLSFDGGRGVRRLRRAGVLRVCRCLGSRPAISSNT